MGDSTKAEQFAEQTVGVLNNSMLGLMMSIGHRTGLFDRMAELPAQTSTEIATATDLQERWVREWLAAMVTGKVVEYDPTTGTYALPPEHASCITRGAGTDNLAMFMQYIAMLGRVEDQIVECFTSGGGVPYIEYPDFQKLMAEESAQIHDQKLVHTIVPIVPGLPDKLTAGIDVLDAGCGQGHALNLLASAFPNSRFTGIDIADEGVEIARSEARELSNTNTTFNVGDLSKLDAVEEYDLVTAFDVIHDQAHPDQVVRNIYASLRPGGTFLCVDIRADSDLAGNIDHPLGPTMYAISTMHCMSVSLAQDGAGLGSMWGEQKAKQMMSDAGFENLDVRRVDGDIQNNYYIATKA